MHFNFYYQYDSHPRCGEADNAAEDADAAAVTDIAVVADVTGNVGAAEGVEYVASGVGDVDDVGVANNVDVSIVVIDVANVADRAEIGDRGRC